MRISDWSSDVCSSDLIVAIKRLCRIAGVEKIDAGPKGTVVTFRNNSFANPAGLIDFITRQAGTAKLRPDHRLLFQPAWDDARQRLTGENGRGTCRARVCQ